MDVSKKCSAQPVSAGRIGPNRPLSSPLLNLPRPSIAVVLPDGNYYLPGTDEIIPADVAASSPDDRFHHCIYYPLAKVADPWSGPVWEDKPKTRCFLLQ